MHRQRGGESLRSYSYWCYEFLGGERRSWILHGDSHEVLGARKALLVKEHNVTKLKAVLPELERGNNDNGWEKAEKKRDKKKENKKSSEK